MEPEKRTGKTGNDGTVLWESEELGGENGPCGRAAVVCVLEEGGKNGAARV